MSSKRYATPLRFGINHSPRLQGLFLFILTLSLFSLWLTPVSILYRGGIALFILTLAWYCWFRRAELGAEAVSLIWQEQGWLWQQGGREQRLVLDGRTFVTPALVLLLLREERGRKLYHVVMFSAEYNTELLRQLRVRLSLERSRSD